MQAGQEGGISAQGGRGADATSKSPGGTANESLYPSPEVCCTDNH